MHRKAKSFGPAVYIVLYCTALRCTVLFLISLMKTMHVAEAVPHFSPKIAKNDVLSQKTQKTQVSETLATVSGPSLARVSEIWVFWVFWDSTSFWISYGYKFGTASAKCMVLKKNPAQLQSSGAKPRSHVLLRAKGRHSHKIAWDSCFCVFGDSVSFFISFLLASCVLVTNFGTVHHF